MSFKCFIIRSKRDFSMLAFSTVIALSKVFSAQTGTTYKVVDTRQLKCYNNTTEITAPTPGQSFYGQDAQYSGNQPSYQDNSDGTVTELVSGLMWQQSPDMNDDGIIDYSDKMYYDDALANALSFNLAGYSDWRLPTIKELYSLIMFYGAEPNPNATSQGSAVPFINMNYFDFGYGDLNAGERIIDAQYATSTIYVSTTMGGDKTMFGVNFADGRIKGYPSGTQKKYYVLYVRGNPNYGINQFVDNGNGTITDNATGLMWMENDNGESVLWENALSYAEGFAYAGYTDWRLPNAKELQSIIDYNRSPATTSSAAIDPMFNCTQIANEAGEADYPFYWSGTTFSSQSPTNGRDAAYVCFGRALGYMAQHGGWIDVHGAGAQRSDPKTGNPANYPYGHGPQGDAVRIYNYVRCVRNASATVPVEFFGFDANQQDDTVVVRWSTGSESNNLGFNIERSSDQKTFIAIGFVRGQGTTNVTAEYEFTDEKIPAGYLYYRIKQIDYDGTATYSPVLEVVVSEPKKYHLEQNYPNPFNPSTTISFTLPNTEQATLKIYNLLGEEVVILINEYLPSGRHSIPWNAENLESGIYFYQLVCGEFAEKKKMMLLIQ